MSAKLFLLLGSANAMLGVILGAFGAHALKNRLTEDLLQIWHTGVEYHFYHALGLILVGILCLHWPTSAWLRGSGWLMLAGIVIFSGSLYMLCMTNLRWLGMVTPLGGLAFIAAWLVLFIAVLRA
ncbi:MAG: DUF423 domain-containing protein [Gammaproteobacteria bacterium]